jgi:hypothetical protein
MITLNKLAPKILEIIESRFHFNENTSKKAFSLKISAAWRKLDELSNLPTDDIKYCIEYKKRAADVIIITVAFLKRYGCEDIEEEIKELIDLFSEKQNKID